MLAEIMAHFKPEIGSGQLAYSEASRHRAEASDELRSIAVE
jgi:hypothetical protein